MKTKANPQLTEKRLGTLEVLSVHARFVTFIEILEFRLILNQNFEFSFSSEEVFLAKGFKYPKTNPDFTIFLLICKLIP